MRDFLAFRVCDKPTGPSSHELFDFIFAYPIMFVVVENRQQDVQMLQHILQALLGSKDNTPVSTFTPVGKLLVKGVMRGIDLVTEGLKQSAKKYISTTARYDGNHDLQRQSGTGKFLPNLTSTTQGRTESPS